MKCSKCGVDAPEGAKYCGSCGATLSEGVAPDESASVEAATSGRKFTFKQWILVGCAGAVLVVGVAWGAFALRKPVEPTPVSKPAVSASTTEPTVAPVPEPVAEAPQDAISTPEKGSAERTEILDAIREYSNDEGLVFIVDALLVQGDRALADVHPTPATDVAEIGRMWYVLTTDDQGWFVDDALEPSEADVEAAQGRWPWASTELLERFFTASAGAPVDVNVAQASSDGATLESLSREDIKPGLVFVLEKAHVMDVVRNTSSGSSRTASKVAGDYRFIADGSQVKVTSNEMDAGYFDPNNRPTLVFRVVDVPSGVPADRALPVTVEFVRAQ